ncbi:hypothetical protein BGZ51_007316 [Haplosporangium sp. Z 767]|nr:hypothetical protein BGZ50_005739 [Haplosporangium sp. Z 11]KAF9191460.1 hypothetical protein BGZ51_007316 [Haplosporangium sp. Z 767]
MDNTRRRSGSRSRSRSPYTKRRDFAYDDRGKNNSRRSRSRSPRSRSRSPRGRGGARSRSRSPIRDRDRYSRRQSYSRSRSRSPRRNTGGGGRGGSGRGRGGGADGPGSDRGFGRGQGRGGGPKHESTFKSGHGGGSGKPNVWGAKIMAEEEEEKKKKPVVAEEDKEKPNFGLSGALAAETNTTVNGTVLKYNEPPEARKPNKRWRLYVFKGDKEIDLLHIHRQSAFLFGRDRNVVDVPIDHPSCSKQHAVLQFRQIVETDAQGHANRTTKPFIIDLESSNGTFVNGTQIPPTRYYELKLSDVIKFGASTREFVLLHDSADAV